jgi:ankyrin repeat protein
MKMLLRAGENVNKPGFTALHYASEDGHVEVVKMLVNADADVDSREEDGWSPSPCLTEWTRGSGQTVVQCSWRDVDSNKGRMDPSSRRGFQGTSQSN